MGASASDLKEALYLSDEQAAAKSADFLFAEIGQRLAGAPARFGVFVQLAGVGNDVTDSSAAWPMSRTEIPFGTITLTGRVDDAEPENRKIIFDPIPRFSRSSVVPRRGFQGPLGSARFAYRRCSLHRNEVPEQDTESRRSS